MKVEFHPSATESFNKLADVLLGDLRYLHLSQPGAAGDTSRPEVFVSATIDSSQILGPIKVSLGQDPIHRVFSHQAGIVGFIGESLQKYLGLVKRIHEKTQDLLSFEFLEETVFSWFEGRYKKTKTAPLIEYIQNESESRISEIEIWIPIYHLMIDTDLKVGKVLFKPISRKFFDDIELQLTHHARLTVDRAQQAMNKERRQHQGYAAGTLIVRAEEKRAVAIAFDEVEKACCILAFFYGATTTATGCSYCVPYGRQRTEITKYFVIENGSPRRWAEKADERIAAWYLNEHELNLLRQSNFDQFCNAYIKTGQTDFEKKFWGAFLLYAQSGFTKHPHEKLLYILPAIEGLLLKDTNEPIQKNLGERLAFVIGETADERLQIVDCVTKMYGIRSAFMHHADKIENVEVLSQFLSFEWKFFWLMSEGAAHFRTQADFINDIERRKLSGAGLFRRKT